MFIHDLEELKELLNKISEKARDAVVIVEGVSDKQALERLGIHADFFLVSRQSSGLQASLEKLAENHKRALLFLDADTKGKQLAKTAKAILQSNRVNVSDKLGKQLLAMTKSSHVEGLGSLANEF